MLSQSSKQRFDELRETEQRGGARRTAVAQHAAPGARPSLER
jgi:hypothetical protein